MHELTVGSVESGKKWATDGATTTFFTINTPDADGDVGIVMYECKCERLPKWYSVNADAMLSLE